MSAMLDYMQLCRLCLVKEKVNVPIFGDENDIRQIFLKITACLPVKVAQEDNLPKKICDACLYKVDLLYQFWNTTVNAEKQLIQWLTEIGVDVNIKNSDTQTLPILPQSHAHPHSIPTPVPVLKEERPDIVEKPTGFQIPEQQNMYTGYDNLGYPQPEVQLEVSATDTFVQPEPTEEPPPPDPPARIPKKRGRPAGATNKKSPPKKKPTPAPPVVSPRTNSTRRSSATAAAAAVAAAAAAATDSEEDSDGDRLGGMDYDDSDSEDDHITKEEVDSDDYIKPKSFLGVPSSADGEQPGPSGLASIKAETGANATESGSEEAEDGELDYVKLKCEADKYLIKTPGLSKRARKQYKCPKCPKILQYRSKFLQHSFKHMSVKIFVCSVCKKLFKSKSALNVHVNVHNGTIYQCNICQKEYPYKPSFDAHMKQYSSSPFYPCNKCERKFHLKNDLVLHLARDHKNHFTCYSCEESFPNVDILREHVIIHNGNAPTKYQCEFCGRITPGRQGLNSHKKRVHLDLHSVICDICGKKLTSKASLKNHLLMHKGEKPFACEHCGKQFLSRNTLNIHRRTHTGEKPHGCPHCEKRFTQRNSLVVHIRQHTGDRPFGCDLCEEKFVSKSSWKMHRKSKHQLV